MPFDPLDEELLAKLDALPPPEKARYASQEAFAPAVPSFLGGEEPHLEVEGLAEPQMPAYQAPDPVAPGPAAPNYADYEARAGAAQKESDEAVDRARPWAALSAAGMGIQNAASSLVHKGNVGDPGEVVQKMLGGAASRGLAKKAQILADYKNSLAGYKAHADGSKEARLAKAAELLDEYRNRSLGIKDRGLDQRDRRMDQHGEEFKLSYDQRDRLAENRDKLTRDITNQKVEAFGFNNPIRLATALMKATDPGHGMNRKASGRKQDFEEVLAIGLNEDGTPKNLDRTQFAEMTAAHARAVGGGAATMHTMELMMPHNVKMSAKRAKAWLTGDPEPIDQQAYILQMAHAAKRSIATMDSQIKRNNARELEGPIGQALKKKNPTMYKQAVGSNADAASGLPASTPEHETVKPPHPPSEGHVWVQVPGQPPREMPEARVKDAMAKVKGLKVLGK